MPIYEYQCPCGTQFERVLPVARYDEAQVCECGKVAQKVILHAPRGYVQADICYDSPIDGRPITTKQARDEDLARSNCVPYDPGIRQDYERRIRDNEKRLEDAVDRSVDEEIARMPARKKEKLQAEMEGGMDAVPERITPKSTPITTTLEIS